MTCNLCFILVHVWRQKITFLWWAGLFLIKGGGCPDAAQGLGMLAVIWGGRLVGWEQVRRSRKQNKDLFCVPLPWWLFSQGKLLRRWPTCVCQEARRASLAHLGHSFFVTTKLHVVRINAPDRSCWLKGKKTLLATKNSRVILILPS